MKTSIASRISERSEAYGAYLKALLDRDASFDGMFVFGVTSTGVYCRSSCPSRRPAVNRIVIFPDFATAENAGFRGCVRCKPRAKTMSSQRAELVQRMCEYIQAHAADKITLTTLGRQFGVSKYHLHRVFKGVMGISPHKYVEECRINMLKTHLAEGESVTTALRRTGRSQSWLYENSTLKLGMTPGTYRRGGAEMRIAYLTGASPLGRLLVAATSHGICAVHLADTDAELVSSLHKKYPRAVITESREVADLMDGVQRWFTGQQLNLPLDLRGTAFQRRVWAALQTIPYGAAYSYSDVANMVGEPRAVRAVANACGANPVPLIVPCHRVIRKDGSLGGYGLGIERKRTLLAEERSKALRLKATPELRGISPSTA